MIAGRPDQVGWVFALLLLAVFQTACDPNPDLRGWQNLDRVYEDELLRWTRSGRVYHSLDRILFVHATFFSERFRRALNTQYLTVFGIEPGKADTDLEMIATSAGRGYSFFLFADMTDFSWNNLNEPESAWRVSLWSESNPNGVPPREIHRFRGRGPNLRAFFPYMGDFGRPYLVEFPKDDPDGKPILKEGNGTLTVKLSSAFGAAAMSWNLTQ